MCHDIQRYYISLLPSNTRYMCSGADHRNHVLSPNGGLCKLLLCFPNKPCEISRHGGSSKT